MNKGIRGSVGEKLKKARESLGLTLKEVATEVGFANYQTLINIEAGKREIKVWELVKLARVYYRDIDYFLEDGRIVEAPSVLWRKSSSSLKINIYERRFLKYCENYRQIEELLGTNTAKKFKPIQCKREDFVTFSFVERLAHNYHDMLGFGSRPACCIYRILDESFGVKVLLLSMGKEGSGGSTVGNFGPSILINADDAPWRRNFDLAHEFFHIVTWGIFDPKEIFDSPKRGKSKVEVWADAFAATLLLPQEEVLEGFKERIKNGKVSYFDCVESAREFEVSVDAFLWRLASLGMMKREEVEKVLNDPALKKLYWQEKSGGWKDTPKFPSRYVNMAFKCMQTGKVSRGQFADYMEIDRQEIPQFLTEYGLDENADYEIELTAS